MLIQGVEVEDDREIDMCTTKDGVYAIEKILKPYQIEETRYQESATFKAYVGKYLIDGITIEVMGDPEKLLESGEWIRIPKENITITDFEGNRINIFTLKSELNYHQQTSIERPERKVMVEKIQKRLDVIKYHQ